MFMIPAKAEKNSPAPAIVAAMNPNAVPVNIPHASVPDGYEANEDDEPDLSSWIIAAALIVSAGCLLWKIRPTRRHIVSDSIYGGENR